MKISRWVAVIFLSCIALIVTADCVTTCQEEYDQCMRVSKAAAKASICATRLRACKLECATNGE